MTAREVPIGSGKRRLAALDEQLAALVPARNGPADVVGGDVVDNLIRVPHISTQCPRPPPGIDLVLARPAARPARGTGSRRSLRQPKCRYGGWSSLATASGQAIVHPRRCDRSCGSGAAPRTASRCGRVSRCLRSVSDKTPNHAGARLLNRRLVIRPPWPVSTPRYKRSWGGVRRVRILRSPAATRRVIERGSMAFATRPTTTATARRRTR